MSIKRRLNKLEFNIPDNESKILYTVLESKVLDNEIIKFNVKKDDNGKVIYLDKDTFFNELDDIEKGKIKAKVSLKELSIEELRELAD